MTLINIPESPYAYIDNNKCNIIDIGKLYNNYIDVSSLYIGGFSECLNNIYLSAQYIVNNASAPHHNKSGIPPENTKHTNTVFNENAILLARSKLENLRISCK